MPAKSTLPEYNIWRKMMSRCNDPLHHAYKSYGGRGIKVCRRWRDFAKFLADVGTRPTAALTLDRIKNNKGYCPSNVRWATRTQQNRNHRGNVFVVYNGKRKLLIEWAEELGTPIGIVRTRLRLGWSIARALTFPVARRDTMATLITFNGQTKTKYEWLQITGLPGYIFYNRKARNWTMEKILSTPFVPRN